MGKLKKFRYVPTSNLKYDDEKELIEIVDESEKEACRCCDYLTVPKGSIAFICPVCFWETDLFIESENEESDQNAGLTIKQARINYSEFGACDKKMLKYVRKPMGNEKK